MEIVPIEVRDQIKIIAAHPSRFFSRQDQLRQMFFYAITISFFKKLRQIIRPWKCMAQSGLIIKACCDHRSKCLRKFPVIRLVGGLYKFFCCLWIQIIRIIKSISIITLCQHLCSKNDTVSLPVHLKIKFRNITQLSGMILRPKLCKI